MRLSTIIIALSAVLFVSCSSERKKHSTGITSPEDYLRPATMQYTSNDSAAINALVEQYIECIKSKDFNGCAEMLYKVKDDEIEPLSKHEKDQLVSSLRSFPIYDLRQSTFILRSDKNNEIELTLQIIADGDLYKKIGTTTQSLNPVYKDNTWYLTLLDKHAEGVENVYEVKN